MAVILADTYEAFLDAGASVEKARKASEEIAGLDKRLVNIDKRLSKLELMVSITMAGTIAIIGYLTYILDVLFSVVK